MYSDGYNEMLVLCNVPPCTNLARLRSHRSDLHLWMGERGPQPRNSKDSLLEARSDLLRFHIF